MNVGALEGASIDKGYDNNLISNKNYLLAL
jgi:hypothetical protein